MQVEAKESDLGRSWFGLKINLKAKTTVPLEYVFEGKPISLKVQITLLSLIYLWKFKL